MNKITNNSFTPSLFSINRSFTQKDYCFEVVHETFKKFEHFWSYTGKGLIVIRHLLNNTAQSCRFFSLGCQKFNGELAKTVTKLQLFALVSIPLNVISLLGQTNKIGKAFAYGDYRGGLLGGIGCSLLITDILDSVTTFVQALFKTLSKAEIRWLSGYGMTFALSMIVQGTFLRSVRLKNLLTFRSHFQNTLKAAYAKETYAEMEIELSKFVEAKLGNNENLKEVRLERQTNAKVASLLKSLRNLINTKHLTKECFSQLIVEIDYSLKREVRVQKIYLLANAINSTALLLFYTSMPLSVPFAALATGFTVRIGAQAYQDFT